MKKFYKYLFRSLPTLAILALFISSACSSAASPTPTSELTQGNVDQQYSVAPPYEIPENWDSVSRYTVQELKQKMDDKEKYLLVDVRYSDEFATSHLPTAVSAPLQDIIAGKWLPTGSIGDLIILY